MDQLQPAVRTEPGFTAENLFLEQAGVSQQPVQVDALIVDQINQYRWLMMRGDEGLICQIAVHQATRG